VAKEFVEVPMVGSSVMARDIPISMPKWMVDAWIVIEETLWVLEVLVQEAS
jgi:hypothetical protein